MSRAINRLSNTTIAKILDMSKDFERDENGNILPNAHITLKGRASMERAQREAVRKFGTNVMVLDVEYRTAKAALSADVFFVASLPCVEGASYGHDCIVQTFKVTNISYMTIDNGKQVRDTTDLIGDVPMSKCVKYVRELVNSPIACVTNRTVTTQKRWMPRAKFDALSNMQNEN